MTAIIDRIRELNDAFRTSMSGGSIVMTPGVAALGPETVEELFHKIRVYDEFRESNDPYHEHDFGSLEIVGTQIFFKIESYDLSMEYGSPNPADPQVTQRVLVAMLASEY